MKDRPESHDLVSMLKEAAQAVEEREPLLNEVERLRELEGVVMKVTTEYLFRHKDLPIEEKVEAYRKGMKELYHTVRNGRDRVNGFAN